MKKSILNFGKALNKVEQKQINGGTVCPWGTCLNDFGRCSHIACLPEEW